MTDLELVEAAHAEQLAFSMDLPPAIPREMAGGAPVGELPRAVIETKPHGPICTCRRCRRSRQRWLAEEVARYLS